MMSAHEEAMRLFGTAEPPAAAKTLRAGPLEARLENGNLRYIRYHGIEVLRAIAYVVRDRDWGTLVPEMDEPRVQEGPGGFSLAYEARCENGGVCLALRAEIVGSADGHLAFRVEALPDADFETNRCGFTILHPIDGVAGAPVTVEHCDGTLEETVFPELIEPWQPFKSFRALTHRPAPHLLATCRMTGDEFEMEDHRNWSDASFKTYVRPIELPWPYQLPAGRPNRQSVDLRIVADGPATGPTGASDTAIEIAVADETGLHMPAVGLVMAPEETPHALEHMSRLAEIAPAAILCHFDPTVGHGRKALLGFAELQCNYPARYELEYVVACEGSLDAEFARLRANLEAASLRLDALAVCPSVDRISTPPGSRWPECPPLDDIYRAARQNFPDIPLGGGMFSYFTELNRKRPPLEPLNFVTHATCPIVHAADDESVMETLETLPHITRSVRAIIGPTMDYRLGPTTIGMRQNPYGSRTFDNPGMQRLCMANDDPRQRGRFGAAWTAGYAMRIATAGVSRWIPAAFTGPRGIVDEATGVPWPVGEAVATLCRFSGASLLECHVSNGNAVAAIAICDGDQRLLLVSNLTRETLEVEVPARLMLGAYEVQCIPLPDR